MVLIYVDHLIVMGSSSISILQIEATLQRDFPIKDLGSLKYFLSIEMTTTYKGLILNQIKHVLDLLVDTEMRDTKLTLTLLDTRLKLDTHGKSLHIIEYYQELVGKLIYLTITHPNITYDISIVSHLCLHIPLFI